MSLNHDYQERLRQQTALELSPEGLRRFAALPPARRSAQDLDKALRYAADQIEQQSKLIARMRVGLQPFAMAAPSWKGHDSEVIFDGRGFKLTLGSFRAANQLWHAHVPKFDA